MTGPGDPCRMGGRWARAPTEGRPEAVLAVQWRSVSWGCIFWIVFRRGGVHFFTQATRMMRTQRGIPTARGREEEG